MCTPNNSGMKRSLPCMNLISMEDSKSSSISINESNPLLSLMGEHMKFWNESPALAEESIISSNKKRRLSPLASTALAAVETPATAALESFLRFAVDDCEVTSLDHFDDDSSYSSIESTATSSPLCVRNFSSFSSKSCHKMMMPTGIMDVTRGMAQISASS